jgi:phage-related protein
VLEICLAFKAGATVSIEETVMAFEKVFGRGGRFGKATDELAKTFEGTVSMIGDKIFNFKKVLLEAGFFDELKKQFGDLDKFLERNADDLDRIAISVGKNLAQGMVRVVQIGKDLIPTIQKIGSGLKSILDGFMAMPEYARDNRNSWCFFIR